MDRVTLLAELMLAGASVSDTRVIDVSFGRGCTCGSGFGFGSGHSSGLGSGSGNSNGYGDGFRLERYYKQENYRWIDRRV